jgi:hypothetical protein
MMLRRLRARLDQMQGRANDVADLARDLILDIQDGFSVEVVIDQDAAKKIVRLAAGIDKGGKIPMRIIVDPRVDG